MPGRKFKLRPWQKEIVEALYATDAEGPTGARHRAEKERTQLAAALALCHLCGPEAVARGQIYSAAADRNQAAIIYKEMLALVRANEHLSDRVITRDYNKSLEDADAGSNYQALSCDARGAWIVAVLRHL